MQGMKTTLSMGERQMAAANLPEGVRIQKEMDGVRYILPPRDLGQARKAGTGLIIFGAVITTFMIFWMSGPLRGATGEHVIGRLFSIGFSLMGLPGLAIGAGIMLLGIAILKNMGHSEVLVSRDQIWAIECIGPIKLKFKRELNSVERLVVGATIRSRSNGGQWQEMGGGAFSAIRVEGKFATPIFMAVGYPKEFTKNLADSLTASVAELSQATGLFNEQPKTIAVVEETADGQSMEDIPLPRPADSKAVVSDLADGFAVVIPPAGALKGSKGLFFFSFVWNGFMVLFTSVMIFAKSSAKPPWPVYLFIAGFWAIGIGMLLGALNMGKRQTMIAVVKGSLGIKITGLFGTKETRLHLDEVGAVRMGPSGMEVNNVPVMELQVMGKDGKKKTGILSERKEDELLWIAWLIRSKTGLGR